MAIPRVMMGNDEFGLERAGEMFGRARCFWNIWERNGFLGTAKKVIWVTGCGNELMKLSGKGCDTD